MKRCHKFQTLQDLQVTVHILSSSCMENIWYLIPFSISLIAEKDCDQAPISRFGGRYVDCKRPGLRAGCKEVAQRLLFSEDSEDADLARKGENNSQFSSASGQEIKAQNKGCSTQWVSLITIYDITSVFFCFSEYVFSFKNTLCVSVLKQWLTEERTLPVSKIKVVQTQMLRRHWMYPGTTSCSVPPASQQPRRRPNFSNHYRISQPLCSQPQATWMSVRLRTCYLSQVRPFFMSLYEAIG